MSALGRPRQRAVREDHLRNHEKLLDAALELFDTHGLDVSLRLIGERAGISPAGLYRHFANREQLIVEAYDRAAAALSDQVLNTLTHSHHEPPHNRLDLFLDTIVAEVAKHPCYGELAAHGIRLYPERATDPVLIAELKTLIAGAQAAGILADDITSYDLVYAPVVVAGMLTNNPITAAMRLRMMTIMRRGLAPHAQDVATMPPFPDLADPTR